MIGYHRLVNGAVQLWEGNTLICTIPAKFVESSVVSGDEMKPVLHFGKNWRIQ